MISAGESRQNIDPLVADGFGDEWSRFDQSDLTPEEKERVFNEYFAIFPWHLLTEKAIGADIGCGSGRWASVVAGRVACLYCIDPSGAALNVARSNLAQFDNCRFLEAQVGDLKMPNNSLDFAYSLGVLHHVPDTLAGVKACVATLKPGAPFLLYLYYRFDDRPVWFRGIWAGSDLLRRVISKLPYRLRYIASQLVAGLVYWPFARTAKFLQRLGMNADGMPLAYYANRSFYVMRTDALDRFGTRLEQRFTRAEVEDMMTAAGLRNIKFSDHAPYWCAVGTKNVNIGSAA